MKLRQGSPFMFPRFQSFLGWDPTEPIDTDVVSYFARDNEGAVFKVRASLYESGQFDSAEIINLERARYGRIATNRNQFD